VTKFHEISIQFKIEESTLFFYFEDFHSTVSKLFDFVKKIGIYSHI